jgi:hypothetical protein
MNNSSPGVHSYPDRVKKLKDDIEDNLEIQITDAVEPET